MAGTEKRQKTAIIYVRVKPEVKTMLEDQAKAQGRKSDQLPGVAGHATEPAGAAATTG